MPGGRVGSRGSSAVGSASGHGDRRRPKRSRPLGPASRRAARAAGGRGGEHAPVGSARGNSAVAAGRERPRRRRGGADGRWPGPWPVGAGTATSPTTAGSGTTRSGAGGVRTTTGENGLIVARVSVVTPRTAPSGAASVDGGAATGAGSVTRKGRSAITMSRLTDDRRVEDDERRGVGVDGVRLGRRSASAAVGNSASARRRLRYPPQVVGARGSSASGSASAATEASPLRRRWRPRVGGSASSVASGRSSRRPRSAGVALGRGFASTASRRPPRRGAGSAVTTGPVGGHLGECGSGRRSSPRRRRPRRAAGWR
jgi:hypothetical protein